MVFSMPNLKDPEIRVSPSPCIPTFTTRIYLFLLLSDHYSTLFLVVWGRPLKRGSNMSKYILSILRVLSFLTLFRPGKGFLRTSPTFSACSVQNREAGNSKFGTFPNIYLRTIWYNMWLVEELRGNCILTGMFIKF